MDAPIDHNSPQTLITSPATQGPEQSSTRPSERSNGNPPPTTLPEPATIRPTRAPTQRVLDPRLRNRPPVPNPPRPPPPPAQASAISAPSNATTSRSPTHIKEESDSSSEGDDASPAMLEIQKERVVEDLEYEFNCQYDFQRSLYPSLVTKQRIDELMQTPGLYNKRGLNWVTINPYALDRLFVDGPELVDRIYTTISAIMEQLGECGGNRKVVKAGKLKLWHEEKFQSQGAGYSSPSLVIKAEGPSFERPRRVGASTVGFTNVTTCIEVVLETRLTNIPYRQIFIQQPNRQFVRTFTVTEERIHFFHSDRSGIHHGYIANYHHTPEPFIRLIVGLCSLDEEVLGLDSSVQWTVDKAGKKTRGTLTTTDEDKKATKTYELASVDPLFKQYCLAGNRGTVCWAVRDPVTKEELIVKDCWREEGAPAEFENLKKARNIVGVIQMISYEADRRQTKDFGVSRYFPGKGRKKSSMRIAIAQNFIQSRVVVEKYGLDLRYFESEKQLLCAIRDAIAGLRDLYLEGDTVHCDIDWTNILLGKPGAPLGKRGVLIDLDCAKPVSAIIRQAQAVGHCMFFSLSLTQNAIAGDDDTCPKHDYLDDIEASFYLTTALMIHRDGPLRAPEPYPEVMLEWLALKDYEPEVCQKNFEFKKKFLLSDKPADPTKHIAPYWSKASRHLLKRFYAFARRIARAKSKIRDCADPEVAQRKLENLLSDAKAREHYKLVLHLFDNAIKELESSEPDTSVSARKKGKRKMEEPSDNAPGRRTRQKRC
ncbi:hypothetical protein MD484_g4500, partial [Candolleomyces efflorescens]